MLFTGIMLTSSGPKVLEYNTRFGDPESQSMFPLLSQDTDLAEVLLACTEGRLNEVNICITPGFACNVIVHSICLHTTQGFKGPLLAISAELKNLKLSIML